jgi:hypothetical protein
MFVNPPELDMFLPVSIAFFVVITAIQLIAHKVPRFIKQIKNHTSLYLP